MKNSTHWGIGKKLPMPQAVGRLSLSTPLAGWSFPQLSMNKALELKKKLTQSAILDAKLQAFGSESHQYQLEPCLSHQDIQVFESRYNITLPSESKNFMLEICNGGAGQEYELSGIEYEEVIPEKLYQQNYEIIIKMNRSL